MLLKRGREINSAKNMIKLAARKKAERAVANRKISALLSQAG